MPNIIWDDYLYRDDLKTATLEQLDYIEQKLKVSLPSTLKEIMMEHGGESPENLIIQTPNGMDYYLNCFYHAYEKGEDEYDGYTILWAKSCLMDDSYNSNLVPFSHQGNVYICLDYQQNIDEPLVVFVDRDQGADYPHYVLAKSFDEFLEKYLVTQ